MKIEDTEDKQFQDECIATFREVAAGRSPKDLAKNLLASGADADVQAGKFFQLLLVAQFAAEEAANTMAALVGLIGNKCPCPDCTGTAEKCKVN